jgi:methyl-accepting chemotaxis protein
MAKNGVKGKREKGKSKKKVTTQGGRRSIMQTLLAAFMVPVVMMVVLGAGSYLSASSGVVGQYEKSAESTVRATGNYFGLICTTITNKAVEAISNEDIANYYERLYKNKDTDSLEALRTAKTMLGNARVTSGYINSYSIIPEEGSYLTSLSGTMTENPKADFDASPEGQYFVNDKTAKNAWLGYHTYLDGCLNSSPDDYALSFYQKLTRTDSFLVFDVKMETVQDMLGEMDFGKNSVKAIVTRDGREVAVIQNANGDEELVQDTTYFAGQSFFEESRESEELTNVTVQIAGKSYVYIATPVKKTGIMLCTLIPKSNLTEQARSIGWITIVMVILATAVALFAGIIISSGIAKTVKEIAGGLGNVAKGDLTGRFETKRKDEFAYLTQSLNAMLESIQDLIVDMQNFGTGVNRMTEDVAAQAGQIGKSIEHTSKTMEDLAQGVQHQALETEAGNEKMVAFADNINTVAEKTGTMGKAADQAVDAVDDGRKIVDGLHEESAAAVEITRELAENIHNVQKSSEDIKAFADVINSIAGQTNLLSLNASIEAARAGEAGKGFAVVAEEIRKLADESKESGDKIREIVLQIGQTTEKTTESANRTGEMIARQAEALGETVEVFDRINRCVKELVEGIHVTLVHMDTIAQEKNQVQDSIQNISAVAQEMAASTQQVTASLSGQNEVIAGLVKQSEELSEDVRALERAIAKFKVREN